MILFCDVETGGLDPKYHCLLEICMITVDIDFNIMDKYCTVINWVDQDNKIIDEYCAEMHTKNRLIEDCKFGPTLSEVNTKLQQLLETYNEIILAGASVHFDRKFLINYFPWIEKKLHYRMLDIRSLLLTYELPLMLPYPKDLHRALSDTINAIYTAKAYRETLKVNTDGPQTCQTH